MPKKTPYRQMLKDLKISDAEVGRMFGYANRQSWHGTSSKKRIENALLSFHEKILSILSENSRK